MLRASVLGGTLVAAVCTFHQPLARCEPDGANSMGQRGNGGVDRSEQPRGHEGGSDAVGDGCGPTVLALLGDPCFDIGDQVEVAVAMSNASAPITGGQFFLAYSTTILSFVSMSPGDPPFVLQVFESVDEAEGLIDYAVGVPVGSDGTMTDTVMARITFEVIGDEGIPFVVWREYEYPLGLPSDTDMVDAGQEDDVDLTDFASFQRCFTGDGIPAPDDCQCLFDDDGDQDVDGFDYAAFQASFTGPTLWVCDQASSSPGARATLPQLREDILGQLGQ